MKQLIVTDKIVNDFIEQPIAVIFKTYCSKCAFSSYCEVPCDTGIFSRISEMFHIDYTCRIPAGYPSLCERGITGFYQYNIQESIRLSDEARDEFHY
jgi:hypothetical protein